MNQFSNRLCQLGTETAFSVAEDAKEHKDRGNIVYPFHLGDIDMLTPLNIIEAVKKAMYDGKTGYAPFAGIKELRIALAENIGFQRGIKYNFNNVVVQPGGKPVILKFINALLNPGQGVLYPNPGYPIYESQIKYNDGVALPYAYIPTSDGFMIDREKLESMIDKNTRLLIYNNYHNPMGCESNIEEMEWLANLAIKNNLWVLSDEAYFNINYSNKSISIASIPGMRERTVILYTFSKTYAMTGWRLGAAIGPSSIINIFAKLSINDESCTNHFVQYGGVEALNGDQSGAKKILSELKLRRDILSERLKNIEGISLSIPDSTFYLFPDVTEIYEAMGSQSYEDFRLKVLNDTGISFCTREHFGTPFNSEKRKYVRFAYSGISIKDINKSMLNLKKYWNNIMALELV